MREPSRATVLVVDDSPDSLSFLMAALEEAGFTVLVALDGNRALRVIEEATPDVILMDAVMPGMDGFETCRRIKRNALVASAPVVFMTGLSETEHILQGFAAGGVDYLTKPIVPEELIARINAHLANARAALSAWTALDDAGRLLFAVDRDGRLRWCTPQAGSKLAAILTTATDGLTLPPAARQWLDRVRAAGTAIGAKDLLVGNNERGDLLLSFVSAGAPDEILLQLKEDNRLSDEALLKQRLSLTTRESEVLLWAARGKSNRDIGTILGLSPRTVNKHLEQIFTKLGVDNRTSAALLTMQALQRR
jgi:DNA-binding NarL/FixJ family response regulator